MTIAACYLSPEGVVLGADSTSTYNAPSGPHYFNHGQKLFEIGQDSTLGIVTWGLGGLSVSSHRMLIAMLADDFRRKKPRTVQDAAERWASQFWDAYSKSPLATDIKLCQDLHAKKPFDPLAIPAPAGARTKDEEAQYKKLMNVLIVGFCIGGYIPPDRTPAAFQIQFDATLTAKPPPQSLPLGTQRFWGAPNMIQRLIHGLDSELRQEILSSGKWTGTATELDDLVKKHALRHPVVPIRDAIDFTYGCIFSTIKALKFSNYSQICGGPIEIAVITVDRNFRWVRHKAWDAAITEGIPS